MQIIIAPETERIVREELSSGHFQTIDNLILSGVQAWRERNLPHEPAAFSTGAEKARRFAEWARNHPETPPLSDDSVSRAGLNPDRW